MRKRLYLSYQRATECAVPPRASVLRWARAALLSGVMRVTVRFVDEPEGRILNERFRGKPYATNVLSFAYDPIATAPDEEPVRSGDLILCAPVLYREAETQGKSIEAHCAHLIVHGMLHLQGYDHETEPEAEAMEDLERRILARLGFPDPYGDSSSV
ncbi:rRNA maturation RNase YbeY [Hydrogenophilus islandicus]